MNMMRSADDARQQCWIDPKALIGEHLKIYPFVAIAGCVTIGDNCEIGTFSVIGTPPQDTKCGAEHGRVVIGNNVVIREGVVIHAAVDPRAVTFIGDGCYIMAKAIINHDCHVEENVIITSNVSLAGHVRVMKTANVGQGASVHQFSVIGTGAIVGINTSVVKDVPPYMKVGGIPARCLGENVYLASKVTKEHFAAETARFGALRSPKRGSRVVRW